MKLEPESAVTVPINWNWIYKTKNSSSKTRNIRNNFHQTGTWERFLSVPTNIWYKSGNEISGHKTQESREKQGLIATTLSVLEALVFKVDENIHPWTSIHPWFLQHMCTVDSVQTTVYTCTE